MIPVASTSTSVNDPGSTAGTVKAFRLFGVPVRLHFTFILLVVFVAVSVLGSNQSNASYAIFLLGGLVSVLLHELGHAVVAARFGIRTVEIVMFPIGGLSRMERSLKPAAEIWVSLAGPLVNVLLAEWPSPLAVLIGIVLTGVIAVIGLGSAPPPAVRAMRAFILPSTDLESFRRA